MCALLGSISVKSGGFQLWRSYVAADTKMWFRKALGNFNILGEESVGRYEGK
jgi:hypothetical protein